MNTIKKSILIVAAFFAFAGTANAANLNYNYVDLNYVQNNTLGVDFTGFGVDGSFAVSDNMNVVVGYQAPSYSGVSITETKVGVGYHQPMNDQSDWYVRGNYHSFDILSGLGSASGFSVVGGTRMAVSDQFEFDGYIGFASYSGGGASASGMVLGLDGIYKINDQFGVNFGYMSDNDAFGWTGFKIGARMSF